MAHSNPGVDAKRYAGLVRIPALARPIHPLGAPPLLRTGQYRAFSQGERRVSTSLIGITHHMTLCWSEDSGMACA